MLPHQEAYIWGGRNVLDLGPFTLILARASIGVCAETHRFVVPLEPPPPTRQDPDPVPGSLVKEGCLLLDEMSTF